MKLATRGWFALSLLVLVGAATLHTLVLFGVSSAWGSLVHLTLFGWITAMICAVNYHTMPVFAARDFPLPQLIWLHLGVFATGIALTTLSLLVGGGLVLVMGLLVELLAALLFVANVALLITRGIPRPHRPPVPPLADQPRIDKLGTQATSWSGLCLPTALLLLVLTQSRLLGGSWLLAAEHLAALGWVLLMIVGVAYHVLPRFSGCGLRGLGWAWLQLRIHQAALLLMIPSLGFGWPALFGLSGLLMTLAIGLFGWTIWPTLHAVHSGQNLVRVTAKGASR